MSIESHKYTAHRRGAPAHCLTHTYTFASVHSICISMYTYACVCMYVYVRTCSHTRRTRNPCIIKRTDSHTTRRRIQTPCIIMRTLLYLVYLAISSARAGQVALPRLSATACRSPGARPMHAHMAPCASRACTPSPATVPDPVRPRASTAAHCAHGVVLATSYDASPSPLLPCRRSMGQL